VKPKYFCPFRQEPVFASSVSNWKIKKDMIKLSSKIREELGKKAGKLREEGVIPAVLYGPKIKNINLFINEKEFVKIYREAGKSSLIQLAIDGQKETYMVLINDLAHEPIKGSVLHVDLYQPDLTKEIEAEVPLVFEGESLAVKDKGGTLVKNISSVTVKGLPQGLPREIKVNIDSLTDFEKSILIEDLELPEGVKILKSPDEIVALAVAAEKIEEELEKPIEEKVEEVGQVIKEKKEEEEPEAEAQTKGGK
jgi:large subunit ribosomal protein L25